MRALRLAAAVVSGHEPDRVACVILIKELQLKGGAEAPSSGGIGGGHDINCKVEGVGAMPLPVALPQKA
jgi:uncharacterized Zn ribbon protein